MPSKLEFSGSQARITLEDVLTLPYADEIRNVLIKALDEAHEVAITFRNVTELDLSCLQLLCSARRSAIRVNKRLSLAGSMPELVQRSIETAGYSLLAGLPVRAGQDERSSRTAQNSSERVQRNPGGTDRG